MKRLVLLVCGIGLLAAPATTFGFAANFDYFGHVKGAPSASVGFFVKHPRAGHKKVVGFTVAQVPYTCRDAPDGATAGWRLEPKMRVRHRKFEGSGQWVNLPLDPVGQASGRFRRGGIAAGAFKLRGELAGPGTHCRTGLLGWRATKQQLPV